MEFLVHIEVRWPADGDADELRRLTEAERVRGRELVVRMRRLVPAQRAALAARFAEQEAPDTRIDIVRAIWQRQMRAAGRTIDALERANGPLAARTIVQAPRTAQ